MKTYADIVIDTLGGTSAVAAMRNITTGAVSQWRYNGVPPLQDEVLRLQHKELFVVIDSIASALRHSNLIK